MLLKGASLGCRVMLKGIGPLLRKGFFSFPTSSSFCTAHSVDKGVNLPTTERAALGSCR